MYCGNCQQKLKEGAAFCPNCGRKVIYPKSDPFKNIGPVQPLTGAGKPEPSTGNSSKALGILLGVLAGILVVFLVAVLVHFAALKLPLPSGNSTQGGMMQGGNLGIVIPGATQAQLPQASEEQETPQARKARLLSEADTYAGAGEYRRAIQLLDGAWKETGDGDYYEAMALYRQQFGIANTAKVAAGKHNTVWLRSDGRVAACGDDSFGELAANSWTNVVAIGAGDHHIVALRSNGTLLAAGELQYGQCDVYDWENIVAISVGDFHTVGLSDTGMVYATGYDHAGQCDMAQLMYAAGGRRILAVAAGYVHTLALLEDGRVVACGDNTTGEGNVSGWTDIAAIYAGTEFSAGLKADGTVVVAGAVTEGWDVSGWADIVNLAAGDAFLVGVKADGTVVAVGEASDKNPFLDPAVARTLQGVIFVGAGHDHAVAVHNSGVLLCVGSNQKEQCDCHGQILE